MTVKLFATGVAAVAAIGAAAAGATSLAGGAPTPQVAPVVLSAPLDPPPAPGQPPLPSPEQLTDLANQVTNPGVNWKDKNNLVANGITSPEGHDADHLLRRAYEHGNFPEQFAFTNIEPIPGNGASADVTITGPKFAGPVEKKLAFVDQGGNWVLQHDAALALVQAASAIN